MGYNECIKCKQKQNKREKIYVFPCDSCNTYYCGECSNLTTSEVRCMPIVERKLKFFCTKCRENDFIECLKNTMKTQESRDVKNVLVTITKNQTVGIG